MSDLIGRQAAIDLIERMKPYQLDGDDCIEIIANMPSAQPEIIRCKDCKNWKRQVVSINDGLGSCSFHEASFVSCDGYCYWAERREDG